MNLEDILYLFFFIAERLGYNKDITLDEFNHILKFADRELRNQVYGNDKSPLGYATSQKRTDSLRKSYTSATVSLTTGVGSLPADYFHASSVSSGTTKVNLVTDYEIAERLDNAILSPSTTYPICIIGDDNITVYPNTISSVTLKYIKHSAVPKLVLKSENGIYVYDSANSVAPDWAEEDYIDLLRIMLGYIGLSVGVNDIVQYVEQKQSAEND